MASLFHDALWQRHSNGRHGTRDPDMILYDDKFCQIVHRALIIKHYYYPSGKSLRIPLDGIIGIQYEKGHVDWKTCKGWGMSLNHIWWARDTAREFDTGRFSVVVQAEGNYGRSGFSVENIRDFLAAMSSAMNGRASFEDKIFG